MSKTEELLEKILAELVKINSRADQQYESADERSSSVDELVKMATKALGGGLNDH